VVYFNCKYESESIVKKGGYCVNANYAICRVLDIVVAV